MTLAEIASYEGGGGGGGPDPFVVKDYEKGPFFTPSLIITFLSR